ncbi:glycerate kinase [Thalassotalea sp. ND16A]|uniref:glycerate kinase n=1 Tax=Thalassotalea sp. ND16A TaxID=1535422 RepID=UPI001F390018|nr:glycerate kinase [Thalassotalea sp. ND16A]
MIAPDSFKECLTAFEVASAIESGFKQVFPDANYVKVPMADGGEGTVQAMVDATNGRIVNVYVKSPLGDEIAAFYGILGDGKTAVIEMSAASGLHLVAAELRDPKVTCSYGTGQLINHALEQDIEHIIIGLGGSATNDGGAGMLTALGARLLDQQGHQLAPGGGHLTDLRSIDLSQLHPKITQTKFDVACDVQNPLCGEHGASVVFAAQKGASASDIEILDQGLLHLGKQLERICQQAIVDKSGAGAAGGMGASLLAILNANLSSGVDIVMTALDLASKTADANLVITGEGRMDKQTLFGKTPIGVARIAKQTQCPVIAIVGCVEAGYEVVFAHGIDAVFPVLSAPSSLPAALAKGYSNIERAAVNIAKTIFLANHAKPLKLNQN